MKTKPINPKHAPKGYIAVEIPLSAVANWDICSGCAFVGEKTCDRSRPCCWCERKDGCNVIFHQKV